MPLDPFFASHLLYKNLKVVADPVIKFLFDEHKSKCSPLDVYFSESIPFATNNINEELNELDIQANIEQAKIHNECS